MNGRISRDVPTASEPHFVVNFSCLRVPGALFVQSAFRIAVLMFRFGLNFHGAVDIIRFFFFH